MTLRVVRSAERLSETSRKISMVIAGRAKVGKTSLLLTLPEAETLALDFEAGLAAVEGRWRGDSIPLRSWIDTVNVACLLGGPDPSKAPEETFSQAHYDHVVGVASGIDAARYKTIFVGGLDHHIDELSREVFELQTEGAKTGTELPYIVDQIITMSDFDYDPATGAWSHNLGKGAHRAFCCRSPNPWGLPAGDRSGRLELIEEPHLGRLIAKINQQKE